MRITRHIFPSLAFMAVALLATAAQAKDCTKEFCPGVQYLRSSVDSAVPAWGLKHVMTLDSGVKGEAVGLVYATTKKVPGSSGTKEVEVFDKFYILADWQCHENYPKICKNADESRVEVLDVFSLKDLERTSPSKRRLVFSAEGNELISLFYAGKIKNSDGGILVNLRFLKEYFSLAANEYANRMLAIELVDGQPQAYFPEGACLLSVLRGSDADLTHCVLHAFNLMRTVLRPSTGATSAVVDYDGIKELKFMNGDSALGKLEEQAPRPVSSTKL